MSRLSNFHRRRAAVSGERQSSPALAGMVGVVLRAGLLAALLGQAPAQAAVVKLQVSGAQGQPLADAVLMLEPQGARPAVKPLEGIDIAQENRAFLPLVTVVTVGTKVQFPNRDSVRHHVYSFSDARKFELKLYVGKPEKPVSFDKAGVVVLGCNIHDQMVGWVVITDTPWYGKSAANGHVDLADVPAGSYILRTWHAGLPPGSPGIEQPVVVGASAQTVAVKLGVR
jgi:plastocyanin